jgi:hypothetical protein
MFVRLGAFDTEVLEINLKLSIDFMNPIGETVGMIETLMGLLVLKVLGKVYLRVFVVFCEISTLFLLKVVSGNELGILSFKLISACVVTELLSLIRKILSFGLGSRVLKYFRFLTFRIKVKV